MIFRPELAKLIVQRKKSQTRRQITDQTLHRPYIADKSYAVCPGRGKPAICRITLTDVRQERLGDLTLKDAKREGFVTTQEFFDYWAGEVAGEDAPTVWVGFARIRDAIEPEWTVWETSPARSQATLAETSLSCWEPSWAAPSLFPQEPCAEWIGLHGHTVARRGLRPLSPSVRSPRSDEDVVAAAVRLVRAVGRRSAESDPDSAHWLTRINAEIDIAFAGAVSAWRAAGFTDGQIGRELGVTKQAVAQRWPRS